MIGAAQELQYVRHMGVLEERLGVAARVKARESASLMECEQVGLAGVAAGLRTPGRC